MYTLTAMRYPLQAMSDSEGEDANEDLQRDLEWLTSTARVPLQGTMGFAVPCPTTGAPDKLFGANPAQTCTTVPISPASVYSARTRSNLEKRKTQIQNMPTHIVEANFGVPKQEVLKNIDAQLATMGPITHEEQQATRHGVTPLPQENDPDQQWLIRAGFPPTTLQRKGVKLAVDATSLYNRAWAGTEPYKIAIATLLSAQRSTRQTLGEYPVEARHYNALADLPPELWKMIFMLVPTTTIHTAAEHAPPGAVTVDENGILSLSAKTKTTLAERLYATIVRLSLPKPFSQAYSSAISWLMKPNEAVASIGYHHVNGLRVLISDGTAIGHIRPAVKGNIAKRTTALLIADILNARWDPLPDMSAPSIKALITVHNIRCNNDNVSAGADPVPQFCACSRPFTKSGNPRSQNTLKALRALDHTLTRTEVPQSATAPAVVIDSIEIRGRLAGRKRELPQPVRVKEFKVSMCHLPPTRARPINLEATMLAGYEVRGPVLFLVLPHNQEESDRFIRDNLVPNLPFKSRRTGPW